MSQITKEVALSLASELVANVNAELTNLQELKELANNSKLAVDSAVISRQAALEKSSDDVLKANAKLEFGNYNLEKAEKAVTEAESKVIELAQQAASILNRIASGIRESIKARSLATLKALFGRNTGHAEHSLRFVQAVNDAERLPYIIFGTRRDVDLNTCRKLTPNLAQLTELATTEEFVL